MPKRRSWLTGSNPSQGCVRRWRPIPWARDRDRPRRIGSNHYGSAISGNREKGLDCLAATLHQFEVLHLQAGAKRRDVPAISAIVHAAGSEKMVRVFEKDAQSLRIELELIDSTLDEHEYQQILDRIDVLVLPYEIDRYARKGSGSFRRHSRVQFRLFALPRRRWSTS
jgi:hypothetical protein